MHEDLLHRYGGEEGGGHRGSEYEGVEAAVQAVKNSYYTSNLELGAALAVYIVQGHVFMDGNKRAGSAAMNTFFLLNNVRTKISNEALIDCMLELQARAEAGERTDVLVEWVAQKLMEN